MTESRTRGVSGQIDADIQPDRVHQAGDIARQIAAQRFLAGALAALLADDGQIALALGIAMAAVAQNPARGGIAENMHQGHFTQAATARVPVRERTARRHARPCCWATRSDEADTETGPAHAAGPVRNSPKGRRLAFHPVLGDVPARQGLGAGGTGVFPQV